MKNYLILGLLSFVLSQNVMGQTIPFGESTDTIINGDGNIYPIVYYKPINYDSINGTMILYNHGSGGSGYAYIDLKDIADRHQCLVVAPSMSNGEPATGYTKLDTIMYNVRDYRISKIWWSSFLYKKIYRHVLSREHRDTIWTYFTGFSAGGQSVTRHMLIRQAEPDSIPLRMAVSCSPLYYTFPSRTAFITNPLYECLDWPFGIGEPLKNGYCDFSGGDLFLHNGKFISDGMVNQYYSENYGVLCGTFDNASSSINSCSGTGGNPGEFGDSRYERSLNFFNFCSNDATVRNKPFNWVLDSVPGQGHYQYGCFNTKRYATDTISIFENMLFNSVFHNDKIIYPPESSISYDYHPSNCGSVYFQANTVYNSYPISVKWYFGDGDTSVDYNPIHTYNSNGTYQISLVVSNILGSDSSVISLSITDSIINFCAASKQRIDSCTFWPNCTMTVYYERAFSNDINTYPLIVTGTDSIFIQQDAALRQHSTVVLEIGDSTYYQNYVTDNFNTYDDIIFNVNKQSPFINPGYYKFKVYGIDSITNCQTNIIDIPNFFLVESPNILSKINSSNNFVIKPNPNNGIFTIMTNYSNISIANILGEIIYSNKSTNTINEIDLSSQSKGIYFITVKDKGVSETKKVIIE